MDRVGGRVTLRRGASTVGAALEPSPRPGKADARKRSSNILYWRCPAAAGTGRCSRASAPMNGSRKRSQRLSSIRVPSHKGLWVTAFLAALGADREARCRPDDSGVPTPRRSALSFASSVTNSCDDDPISQRERQRARIAPTAHRGPAIGVRPLGRIGRRTQISVRQRNPAARSPRFSLESLSCSSSKNPVSAKTPFFTPRRTYRYASTLDPNGVFIDLHFNSGIGAAEKKITSRSRSTRYGCNLFSTRAEAPKYVSGSVLH